MSTSALIDRLAATPRTLALLVVEETEEGLDAAPPGEWSARTLLAHLRDDEYLCMRVALERMLAQDDPEVLFIEGEDWEPGRNRGRDRRDQLLADFALQRQASVSILRMLRPEDWSRLGHMPGLPPFTVESFLRGWIHHDEEHIAQLEQVLGASLEEILERRRQIPAG